MSLSSGRPFQTNGEYKTMNSVSISIILLDQERMHTL